MDTIPDRDRQTDGWTDDSKCCDSIDRVKSVCSDYVLGLEPDCGLSRRDLGGTYNVCLLHHASVRIARYMHITF